MAVLDDKSEARKQWDTDPCGASTAAAVVAESAQWYASVREHRYHEYAPWLPALIDASRWCGADVLEIGVGLGSDHLTLARAGARMHALDLSAEHLRHTQRHLALNGMHTNARLGDAENNPWGDASFDFVYSFGVLHHTPDTVRAVREIHRVLRPGGTALIGLYHRDSVFYWLWTMLWRGIILLGLLRRGRRRLLAEIEHRSPDNDALPLVKVYSRRQARGLFTDFANVTASTHCIAAIHFPPPLCVVLRKVPAAWFERWLSFAGWYVCVRATKGS